jgi:hypothetical protein
MIRYIKTTEYVAAALGELVGPMAKTESQAVSLLTDYLLNDSGRNRFYEVNPGSTETEYYEALYQLYDAGRSEDLESTLSGAKATKDNQCCGRCACG